MWLPWISSSKEFSEFLSCVMQHSHCSFPFRCRGKRGFVSKRLILFTDAGAPFGEDQLGDIIGGLKEQEIELNVM